MITGAGGGIGREHALLLASRGANVVVNDVAAPGFAGAPPEPERVVEEIRTAGGKAVADRSDVSTREGADALLTAAVDAFGSVDILINNAGIAGGNLDDVIAVNLLGCFHVTGSAWPGMIERGYGRVVNTTSGAGLLGFVVGERGATPPAAFGYGAAKMGVVGLTRNLALQGATRNVKVNAMAPVAHTRLTAMLPDGDFVKTLRDRFPPRLISPLVAFLAHEHCPVSGEVFGAGGGIATRFFLAETPGHYDPELTVESVRDNFDRILSEEGYRVFGDATQELAAYVRRTGP